MFFGDIVCCFYYYYYYHYWIIMLKTLRAMRITNNIARSCIFIWKWALSYHWEFFHSKCYNCKWLNELKIIWYTLGKNSDKCLQHSILDLISKITLLYLNSPWKDLIPKVFPKVYKYSGLFIPSLGRHGLVNLPLLILKRLWQESKSLWSRVLKCVNEFKKW